MAAGLRGRAAPLLAALLLSAGCGGSDDDLARRVDAVLAPLVEAKDFGGAVVLARDGEVLYRRGFGMANHERGVPFTPDTPSDGGSIAKTFTAAGIAWLVDEGKVDLDAPVRRYVPEFPHAETTVRHLVTHSNGLPPDYEFFDPHFAKDEVRTTAALLRVVAKEAPSPSFPPGSRFEYSNLGFDAAGLVIERVTGTSYEAFLRERFLAPLGMTATFARPAWFADWPGVRTLGYRWTGSAWEVVDVFDGEAFLGASNLYVSAADLARWADAHARGVAIPERVFAAGQVPGTIAGRPSSITLLSWYVDPSGTQGYYTGSIHAFHVLAYWDRARKESVALVTNTSVPPWKLVTLQRDLVAALAGRRPPREEPVPFTAFDRGSRASIAGTWTAEGMGTIVVTAGPRLRLRVGEGLELDVFQVAPEVFYVPGSDLWLAFSSSGMHVRSMFVDFVARRAQGS